MARGDHGALAALYDETCAAVHGLSVRIVRDESAAEDVTIDVYMQAFRQAPGYDTARGTPLAWLLMLARRTAVERVRADAPPQSHAEPPQAVPSAVADRAQLTLAGEPRRLVQAALAGLDPEQRRVIELAYYGGMSQSEIAAALDEPLGTITTRIRLGVIALRDALRALPTGTEA
jgi:RNA polymerase sigma-70 factor (ECF subfamily)